MTNHWSDLQNTDCALIMGGNPAENHPISFRWLTKAKEKGGKIVSVDPRFTRTSSKADVYASLRSGTDIAFMGGMINYALENNLIHREYVAEYTNASFIVKKDFEFNDGLFSGYDEATRKYDKTKWAFETDEEGNPKKDKTLTHPRSVFQLMRKHFSRYDVDSVIAVTGTPKEDYLKVCETFCSTSKIGKSGTIMYAMGTTQHTVGTQNVRAFGIIQLLLGNIGLPGGGINAMRGESNVQGSTDFALLYHLLPGYVGTPTAIPEHATLEGYNTKETPSGGYWSNKPKFLVSMLKAWYGPNATKANEFGYQYLPKGNKNYSHINLFNAMYKGELEGAFLFGTNPVVGGPNAGKEKEALSNLKWMVAVDLWETETSAFWQEEAGSDPSKIDTEVFLLPAASSYEKEGSVSNSSRWMQYRWKAIDPKGESLADLEIIHMLVKNLKGLYKNESSAAAKPINALYWNFGEGHHPDIDLVAREINGYDLSTGKLLKGFGDLKDDGTTSSGNWIYSGFYPEEGKNRSKNRDNKDTGGGNFLNWAYAWPANRRILYNRASADPSGKPWSDKKAVIWWDESQKKWTGNDIPDFKPTVAPADPGGTNPFIMINGGVAGVYAPTLNDGPFPEHYEPFESPVKNSFSSQEINPAVVIIEGEFNLKGDSKKYPIVGTTYRVSEHWQSGSMTRNQEWLSELAGHMYIEMSEELAKEKGIKNKDKIIVSSARGDIKAYAMVTKRFKPHMMNGKKVHQVGMPWHFGYKGYATGDTANRLTPHIGDANTTIPEYKAFLCDIRRAD
ncbi:formate dehydrogenase O alpha subunit /selenocysteine-containing [Mesobacillus selenatarsenatis SF-1]|uniref:Formate dehydrogenase O alpha subunit /selenocysteine-containing n=2 Tax=Mesobacillus selenatarsenatis TaxID=388741 RepID=A0A0A8X3N2_MESS1|nr:formate dehydrogenase O alpha subunit /selenocysteine-containing [Mesobacillus selenatarsenatis SF-1]